MKKLILLFTLISGFAFGQFTVADASSNWEKVGNVMAHTTLYQKKDKSTAKIEYRDFSAMNNLLTYSATRMDFSYYDFEFSTDAETLDKIYDIIKKHFDEKNIEDTTLQFPEGKMIISISKSMGSYYCQFKFEKNNTLLDKGDNSIRTTAGMTFKQIAKLFKK